MNFGIHQSRCDYVEGIKGNGGLNNGTLKTETPRPNGGRRLG